MGLSRMSTTAGVGMQEYRAINPWAVTSVVAGVASWIALLSLILLVVPVLAVVCGAIAIIQVSRSHGTQSGRGLAVAGILLGLVAGGFVAVTGIQEHRQRQAYSAQIGEIITAFGKELSAGDFAEAYALTEPRFRERVTLGQFRGTFETFARKRLEDGRIVNIPPTGATTNDRAKVTIDPATGVAYAEAMLILEYPDEATARQVVRLIRTPAGWRFSSFGDWFPAG